MRILNTVKRGLADIVRGTYLTPHEIIQREGRALTPDGYNVRFSKIEVANALAGALEIGIPAATYYLTGADSVLPLFLVSLPDSISRATRGNGIVATLRSKLGGAVYRLNGGTNPTVDLI